MDPIDLFDILGGRNNLRLMCEAEEFYEHKERGFVRFMMGGKYIWLTNCIGGYAIYVWDIETKMMMLEEVAETEIEARRLFERYTGHSLSF
jgi:hypothetical protein